MELLFVMLKHMGRTRSRPTRRDCWTSTRCSSLVLRTTRSGCGSVRLGGILACLVLLYMTTGPVILHVAFGLCFATVAAYTLVKGQLAASSTERLVWYFCTGATAFLFLYWSFNYVFRPPKNQNTQGCGGVQFIHHEEL